MYENDESNFSRGEGWCVRFFGLRFFLNKNITEVCDFLFHFNLFTQHKIENHETILKHMAARS